MDRRSSQPASASPAQASVTRRTVAVGTMWAAPTLLLTVPAPAMAASVPEAPCVPDPAFSDAAVSFRSPLDPAERTSLGIIVDAQAQLGPEGAESGPFEVAISWTQTEPCSGGISPDTGITDLRATTTQGTGITTATDFVPGTDRAAASIDLFNPDDAGNVVTGQVLLELVWPNRVPAQSSCHGLMDVTVTVSYLSTCGPVTETFRTTVSYGSPGWQA